MISSNEESSTTPAALTLAASLVRLAKAVGELRQAQQIAARAAAARRAAEGLYAALSWSRAGAAALGLPSRRQQAQQGTSARRPGDAARLDFPVPLSPGQPLPAADSPAQPGSYSSPRRTQSPPRRAGPAP